MKYNLKTIWNCEQNKPSLVVDDVIWILQNCTDNGCDSVEWENRLYEILLNRGVFKWLAVRRDLIKLKNIWRDRVRDSYERTSRKEYWNDSKAFEHGYRAALEQCRAEVRALCHSQRWRAPDNDRRAQQWLERQSSETRCEPALVMEESSE